MPLLQKLEQPLQQLADLAYALPVRRTPDYSRLRCCQIVSHRGEHDNVQIKENTFNAFDAVYQEGVWGIEFDIRWSKDLQPVVIHDPDCQRVFGSSLRIRENTLSDLQKAIPAIPSLEQVIEKYGGKMHLMIEIKAEDFRHIGIQQSRLASLLAGLEPIRDFHLLSLDPAVLQTFDIVPKHAMLPVAELNWLELSRLAIERDYGGVAGQYVLMNERLIKTHRDHGQKIGVGFVKSRASFYRELNRGVEWVFSNHAIALNHIRRQLLEKHRP